MIVTSLPSTATSVHYRPPSTSPIYRESPPVSHSVPSQGNRRAQAALRAHKHSRLDRGGIHDEESGVFAHGGRWEAKRGLIRIISWPDVGGDNTRPDDLLLIRDSQRTAQLGS